MWGLWVGEGVGSAQLSSGDQPPPNGTSLWFSMTNVCAAERLPTWRDQKNGEQEWEINEGGAAWGVGVAQAEEGGWVQECWAEAPEEQSRAVTFILLSPFNECPLHMCYIWPCLPFKRDHWLPLAVTSSYYLPRKRAASTGEMGSPQLPVSLEPRGVVGRRAMGRSKQSWPYQHVCVRAFCFTKGAWVTRILKMLKTELPFSALSTEAGPCLLPPPLRSLHSSLCLLTPSPTVRPPSSGPRLTRFPSPWFRAPVAPGRSLFGFSRWPL